MPRSHGLSASLCVASIVALWAPTGTLAADMTCTGTNVSVRHADASIQQRTCDAVARVLPPMAVCSVAPIRPKLIEVTDQIDDAPSCLGLYHCGKDRIEILSPEAMARARDPDSPFHVIAVDPFFDSVVAHKLAHAAYDAVDCPFRNCLLTSEYVAYSAQVLTLPGQDRAAFEAEMNLATPVGRDQLSVAVLMMAPELFVTKVWAHFTQRDDGCAYIGEMMGARFFLDTERP